MDPTPRSRDEQPIVLPDARQIVLPDAPVGRPRALRALRGRAAVDQGGLEVRQDLVVYEPVPVRSFAPSPEPADPYTDGPYAADPYAADLAGPVPGPPVEPRPVELLVVRRSWLDDPSVAIAAAVARSSLRILAVLLVAFVAQVAVIGGLTHNRDQAVLYDQVRESLAKGEAPLGQTDLDGGLLQEGTPIGLLEVPSTGISQVVVEGTRSGTLQQAPGHRRDTVLPGQAGVSIVMGRQAAYGGPFGRLTELRIGDEVLVTTGQGRHTYQVFAVRGAGDPAPAPPAPGTGRLTMMTGDGWAFLPSDVLRVDATLISTVYPAAERTFGAGGLEPSEQVMAGDPDAYAPLLLWASLLLAAVAATSWTRLRWGRWQTWVVSVPVLTALFLQACDQLARLLPNVL